MERADQAAGSGELLILGRSGLERIRHVRCRVCLVGQTARLSCVEAPPVASTRPQVQRRQRIDLSGVRNRRDRSQHALRLVDAGAVVRLNALQVGLDDALRGDLFLQDGLPDRLDRGFLNLESRRASL